MVSTVAVVAGGHMGGNEAGPARDQDALGGVHRISFV
jgi:hypothetical protein